MIYTIILILIAAISKAVSDTLIHHYSTSIFTKYSKQYWDPSVSWLNKYKDRDVTKGLRKMPTPLTDAWHLFNSLMICSFLALPLFLPFVWYHYLISGVLYNLTFSLFYTHIFRK